MAQVIKDVVTWLKQWFYTESEIDTITGGLQTQINNKADSTTVSNLATTVSGKADKTGGVAQITDTNAHSHIGTSANATQGAINTAIDSKLSELVDINFVTVVQTLPTASQSTMGKIYLVPSDSTDTNDNYEEYVTIKDGNTYSWEKFGEITDISVAWNDVTGKPTFSTVATSGSYNDLSNKPTIPDVSGKIDTAGTGLSKSGTTLNHSNSIQAQTSTVFKRIKYDAQGHITGTEDVDANDLPSHLHTATQIGDSNAHSHIGTSAYANQGAINTAIDTAIGGKSDKTATIGTTITLVDKGETNEGCIIFNTIS